MPIGSVSSNPLDKIQSYKDPMMKRLTKAQQPRIDQVKLDHENALERSAALGTLGGLVRNYTKYAHILQDPATNPFNKKAPKLTTTDTLKPEQYISVETSSTAPKMAFNVRVNAIATASKITFDTPPWYNYDPTPNAEGPSLVLDGVLSIDPGNGPTVDVQINDGDTLSAVLRKINNSFNDNGIKASATTVRSGNQVSIRIDHQEMGPNALNVVWAPSNPIDDFNLNLRFRNGTQADITIDGDPIALQDSNLFENIIPGVTIKALAPNDPLDVAKTQKVDIVPDTSDTGAIADIRKFIIAYNDLKVFHAKMTEKTSLKDYADTAVLHNAPEIRQAGQLLDSMFQLGSVIGTGKYTSLSEIGIGPKPADATYDAPSETKILDVVDYAKLSNALNNHYDDVISLFRGGLKVTANSPRGSTLDLSFMTDLLDTNLFGKPMTVTLTPGAGAGDVIQPQVQKRDDNGQLMFNPPAILGGPPVPVMVDANCVKVSIPGITDIGGPDVPILGTYTRKGADTYGYIDFKGTQLEGLRLVWDSMGVTGGADETFTIELSKGLADTAYFRSSDLASEDGRTGTIYLGSQLVQQKAKDLDAEEKKLEAALEEKLEKIEQEFDQIAQLAIMHEIFADAINSIINPS